MVGQIGEYFAKNRLLNQIQNDLDEPIMRFDKSLFQVENKEKFEEFIKSYRQKQRAIQLEIQNTIIRLVDS